MLHHIHNVPLPGYFPTTHILTYPYRRLWFMPSLRRISPCRLGGIPTYLLFRLPHGRTRARRTRFYFARDLQSILPYPPTLHYHTYVTFTPRLTRYLSHLPTRYHTHPTAHLHCLHTRTPTFHFVPMPRLHITTDRRGTHPHTLPATPQVWTLDGHPTWDNHHRAAPPADRDHLPLRTPPPVTRTHHPHYLQDPTL